MLTRLRASLLGSVALLAGIFLPLAAHATTAPVILSLSEDSTFPSQYIGSSLNLYMTAIQPNPVSPFSVSVTSFVAGSGGSVTLGGVFTGVINNPTVIYISDGIRTWAVSYVVADGNSIQINNADFLDVAHIPPSWVVTDYSQLANTTFAVYTGSLVNNATAGAGFTVEVGQFAQAVLYDNGSNGDLLSGDGIWTGQFTVPNNNTVVTNANFYGSCQVAGVLALNQNFQSAQTQSFDMELPAILSEFITTSNTTYDGDLYLSSLSQGLSATNPANVQATNTQARFNFTVNKPNTVVDITIGNPGGAWPLATPKQLPSFVIPNGAPTFNGWSTWLGDDGSQNFVHDGIYPVNFYIHDFNNLVGVTVTAQIKVVSLKMAISDITLSPALINSVPPQTAGMITTVNYNVDMVNDSGTSLNSSLQVLGWADAATGIGVNNPVDLFSTIWTVNNVFTLNATGASTQLNWPASDSYDNDQVLANYFTSFFGHSGPPFYFTAGYNDYISQTNTASPSDIAAACNLPIGSRTDVGDGNLTNDWSTKGLRQMFTSGTGGNTNSNPTDIARNITFEWSGPTPAQNNYRIDIQSQMTGLAYSGPPVNNTLTVLNLCTPTAGPEYVGDVYHFWPQSVPDLTMETPAQGDLITFQNSSAIFVVSNTVNPTSDNTPPQYLSSNPAEGSLIQPNVFTSSNPLSVEFQDPTSALNTSTFYSYITLTAQNGAIVQGTPSTNGGGPNGTLTVYFTPNNPIQIGGDYTMAAFTCNTSNLCVEQTITFTVQDSTSPSIQSNGVVLTALGGPFSLSQFQNAPQGPYENVSQISVGLQMVNSKNSIDYADSSVSLYQISGTTQSPVAMTFVTATGGASQGTLVYAINNVINSAGLYEVLTTAYSMDASGKHYPGPAPLANGTDNPQFTTQFCQTCISIDYTNNPNSNRPAITGVKPITINIPNLGVGTTPASIEAAQPSALPGVVGSGYAFLPTANKNSQIQFNYNNNAVPLTTDLVWTYPPVTPVNFCMYYDAADLNATTQTAVVAPNSLVVVGYNGTGWVLCKNAVMPTTVAPANNLCSVAAPNGSAAYSYYAIAYPSNLTVGAGTTGTPTPGPSGTVTPTPVTFPSTRAFNPKSGNSLNNKARFYYSQVAPATMEARVYDTSGRLIRDLTTMNNGISFNDVTSYLNSPNEYFFTWDGTNDSGTVVRNGIYLVRWTETGTDGSTSTKTKPVALIK